MRVSRDGIDTIKRRNDLAEVVVEHGIELRRRGRTLFGLCPFHEERTASFGVSNDAGLFHCFGCGAGGDVIGFVARFHRIGFPEALGRLAIRAGIDLTAFSAQSGASSVARAASMLPAESRRRLHEQAAARFSRLAATAGRHS
jgi:DNA primase